jgi:hypothetical protein
VLASDLNNRDFQGAMNPDSLLSVEFYMYAPVDKWATESKGKEVRGPAVPFVRIMKPGDNTSILETPVRDDHKARWPDRWLYFQMKEGLISGEMEVPGWKLDDWNEIDEELKRELKFLRFSVVEQIAGASDAQVQKMGMSGPSLREKAKIALRVKMGVETKSAIEQKDKEIADLKRAKVEQDERIAKLEALFKAAPEPSSPEPPSVVPVAAPKRGRPKGSKNKPKEVE